MDQWRGLEFRGRRERRGMQVAKVPSAQNHGVGVETRILLSASALTVTQLLGYCVYVEQVDLEGFGGVERFDAASTVRSFGPSQEKPRTPLVRYNLGLESSLGSQDKLGDQLKSPT